jgi:hypothetical protein
MATKKVTFSKEGIEKLPNDKPVLYRIENANDNLNYVGVAKRGRVQDRIAEHLGEIPGAKVKIEQFSNIDDAEKKEKRVIKLNQPRYNIKGK